MTTTIDLPSLPAFQSRTRAGFAVAALQLAVPTYRTAHVLQAVASIERWPYAPDVERPTRSAVLRAREIVLAVGPLRQGGPTKVVVAPSIAGGVVLSFFPERPSASADVGGDDVSVACLNNQTTNVFGGQLWTPKLLQRMSQSEAIAFLRSLSWTCSTSSTPEL